MCGRGVICLSLEQVQRAGKVKKTAKYPQELKKIVNFSPGMSSPVVLCRPSDGEREVHQMLFGLIPSFTSKTEKPNHYIMFNARIESVVEKPSFKKLILRGKRCIVLFSGFYEWKLENKLKQPYFVYLKDGDIKNESDENQNLSDDGNSISRNENDYGIENENIIMAIAGLYDEWEDSTGNTIRTYTTLTCPACTGFQWLHTRQPVFLTEKLADAWLDPKSDVQELLTELNSTEYKERYSSLLHAYPVTRKMGVASYQDSDCLTKIEKKIENKTNKSISNYFSSNTEKEVKNEEVGKSESECSVAMTILKEEESKKNEKNGENVGLRSKKTKYDEYNNVFDENIGEGNTEGGVNENSENIVENNEIDSDYMNGGSASSSSSGGSGNNKNNISSSSGSSNDHQNDNNHHNNDSDNTANSKECSLEIDQLEECSCPMCYQNISHFTEIERNNHVNDCYNKSEKISEKNSSKISPKKKIKPATTTKSLKNVSAEKNKNSSTGTINNYFLPSPKK